MAPPAHLARDRGGRDGRRGPQGPRGRRRLPARRDDGRDRRRPAGVARRRARSGRTSSRRWPSASRSCGTTSSGDVDVDALRAERPERVANLRRAWSSRTRRATGPALPPRTPTTTTATPSSRHHPYRHHPITTDGRRGHDAYRRDPPALARLLRGQRPRRRALGLADLAGPVDPVRHRRHGAVHPVHARRADPAVAARDQRAEVRAHPRHRGGRQDHPARHVLPDERQLLVRGLLQGRRDHLRLGAGHRARGRPAGSASTRTPSG